MPPEEREAALGRALGRVVAHELDHIFAETRDHGAREFDQPELSADQLLAPASADSATRLHILRTANPAPEAGHRSPEAGAVAFAKSGCTLCHGPHGEGSAHGPVLRAAGRLVTAVMLATRLARSEKKMCQRASALNLPTPALDEGEIQDIVEFLNHIDQQP